MRLTAEHRDLAEAIAERLDRRLRAAAPAPIAVALSGGGDSLALLLTADAWARRRGRDLVVLTVDHGLQAQSAAWTENCGRIAERLGRSFRALAWTGPKPARGLPAAARQARHRLLAEAAREAGARVVLLGHTADDVAEAEAMRRAGSTTPSPREWAPSPLWPQGRDLFLLRPMLGLRRADLRAWLAARGETWVEDPANDNAAYARARARAALAGAGPSEPSAPPGIAAQIASLAALARAEPWGGLSLDRGALRQAPAEAARGLVGAACLCAAGTSRPPRSDRLDRLVDALRGPTNAAATLAGARVEAEDDAVLFLREAGELGRTGVGAESLAPGRAIVWDGRFELVAAHPGLVVQALTGAIGRLDAGQRRALGEIPAAARGALPLVLGESHGPVCPLLRPLPDLTIRPLAGDRLAAACGLVEREP